MTGIWIAEEASDDHRQVIDWLNENTPDTLSLYLVELKAYTIQGSAPAPQLSVFTRKGPPLIRSIHPGGSVTSSRIA
jgi:hypothetical protein